MKKVTKLTNEASKIIFQPYYDLDRLLSLDLDLDRLLSRSRSLNGVKCILYVKVGNCDKNLLLSLDRLLSLRLSFELFILSRDLLRLSLSLRRSLSLDRLRRRLSLDLLRLRLRCSLESLLSFLSRLSSNLALRVLAFSSTTS